ncbi:MAG TPA: hypothetical protein VIJ82_22840 [Streptosporangiaceae bacterium]|jgi:hypothetical protein
MTSEGSAGSNQDLVWRYQDGEWSRTPGPYAGKDTDGSDVEAALEQAGFNHAEELGRPGLPIVLVYEHEDGGKWFLSCCFNHSNVYGIYVPDLPSFLDLMAQLTPLVTATLLSDVAERLDHLVTVAGADADSTYEERTARRPF